MRRWVQDHEPPLGVKPKRIGLSSIIWGLAFVPGKELSFVSSSSLGVLTRQRILLATDMRQASLQPERLGVMGNSMGTLRLAVSPDGTTVAAAGQDKLVSLWRSDEAPNVFWHSGPVDSMRVLTTQPGLVSLDKNGRLFRRDYKQPKLLSRLSLAPSVPFSNSVISYDGSAVATGDFSGTVTIWNGQDGHEELRLQSGIGPIESLAFSKDGALLAAGDVHGKVVLWDRDELVRLPAYAETDSAMKVLRFSPDGKILLGGGCGHPIRFPAADCGRGEIYVWDVASRQLSGVPLPAKSGFVLSLDFNPANPDEFANGTRDGNITIWSLHDRKPRVSFGLTGPSGISGTPDINDLAFSPDGQLLAVALDSYRVYLVNARTGRIFGRYFKEHDTFVNRVAFSPDGAWLLSASGDNTIVLHDMLPEHWLEKACRIGNRNLTVEEWTRYIEPNPATYHQTCSGFQ